MIFDQTGNLANMKRHDYLPFGEELGSGIALRTTTQGYGGGDAVRQQFTLKERDVETGLNYFLARFYSSTQGRFTSPDEFKGGPEELFEKVDPHDPLFYADTSEPKASINITMLSTIRSSLLTLMAIKPRCRLWARSITGRNTKHHLQYLSRDKGRWEPY